MHIFNARMPLFLAVHVIYTGTNVQFKKKKNLGSLKTDQKEKLFAYSKMKKKKNMRPATKLMKTVEVIISNAISKGVIVFMPSKITINEITLLNN